MRKPEAAGLGGALAKNSFASSEETSTAAFFLAGGVAFLTALPLPFSSLTTSSAALVLRPTRRARGRELGSREERGEVGTGVGGAGDSEGTRGREGRGVGRLGRGADRISRSEEESTARGSWSGIAQRVAVGLLTPRLGRREEAGAAKGSRRRDGINSAHVV